MKQNYHLKMQELIQQHCSEEKVPRLLLHSCCAPCSSYCLELLSQYFSITVFYYNPNIYPPEEYEMRVEEQEKFILKFNETSIPVSGEPLNFSCLESQFPSKGKYPISFVEGSYDTSRFYEMAKGMEHLKEGGERCFACYEMRLRESCAYAKAHDFDFFTTTLSISPLKNANKLNEIGAKLEAEYGVRYLYSDFKKKNGYKRSTEISNEYEMYRQYYCGCVYSKKQRDEEIAARKVEEM